MQADRGVGAWRREDGSEEARADATPKGTCVCLSLLLALTSPPKAHPTKHSMQMSLPCCFNAQNIWMCVCSMGI